GVRSEPSAEQNLRAADLHHSFRAGQVFELRQLMSIDTPEAKDWSLYYAQSVSLARFLVEQGTPQQMIQFVRESSRKGIEPALRDIYHIGGLSELEERWRAFARQQLASTQLKRGSFSRVRWWLERPRRAKSSTAKSTRCAPIVRLGSTR